MDMKKILQALDTASSKPVEGSNDMKKFLSVMTEGTNPHKVALPVQMAMQHYTKPEKKEPTFQTESLLRGYLQDAEDLLNQEQSKRKQLIQMYASRAAKRVMENRRDAYQRDYDSSVSGFGRNGGPKGYDSDGNPQGGGYDEYVNGDDDEVRHHRDRADVPHDVHINGKKWKSFGSHSHASNVAKKIKGATVHKSLDEGGADNTNTYFVDMSSGRPMAKTSPRPTAIVASKLWFELTPEVELKAVGDGSPQNPGQGFHKVYLSVNGKTIPGLEGGDQKLGSKIIVTPRDLQSITMSANTPKE